MKSRTWKKWTQEKDDLLRKIWTEPGPVKIHADLFDGRSAHALIARASTLNLGPRGKGMRGVTPLSDLSIRRELAARPMDAKELGAKTGIERSHVAHRLNEMHAAGEVRIHSWDRFGASGRWARIWSIGPGKDAKKPVAPNPSDRERKRLQRQRREEPAKYEDRMARRRLNKQRREAKPARRDDLTAALFGAAA